MQGQAWTWLWSSRSSSTRNTPSQAFSGETHDGAGLKNPAFRLRAKNLSRRETRGLQIVFVRALANAEHLGLLPYQLELAREGGQASEPALSQL